MHGGALRKPAKIAPRALPPVPEPVLPQIGTLFNVLVAGIGGSGVVTVSQTLAVAAYVDGLHSSNLDLTGMSQKYGAVTAHVRIARDPGQLHATRIASGEADSMIGCDLIVAAGEECLAKLKPGAGAVISADVTPTEQFARNPDWSVDAGGLIGRLKLALGEGAFVMDAQRLARDLLGDPIAANMFMLGAAWQRGLVPITHAALMRAIELNGVAIPANKEAFEWGRRAAHDLAGLERLAAKEDPPLIEAPSLDALIERRAAHLLKSRGKADEARYRALVQRVRDVERKQASGEAMTHAVARAYHKLLAVKDEWEVARLYASPDFQAALNQEFEGSYKLHFHIGAWPFARPDPQTGAMGKGEAGPWVMTALRILARLRFLRGTALDPFRNSDERKLERRLVAEYETDIDGALARLTPASHDAAVRLANLPETIRGYGRVKEANAVTAAKEREAILRDFAAPKPAMEMAA